MRKLTALLAIVILVAATNYFVQSAKKKIEHLPTKLTEEKKGELKKLQSKAIAAKKFVQQKNLSDNICFLVDMNLSSGKKRFFVYDFKTDTIIAAGLMAHGSCNETYLAEAKFSNTPDASCSSLGKYLVSYKYKGKFGDAFKLYGLDSTNSNAFNRFIVLHGYSCVPDVEAYPETICNSLGCPMVSYNFLSVLNKHIQKSPKPILLWMFQ